jgi:hypothetical protein
MLEFLYLLAKVPVRCNGVVIGLELLSDSPFTLGDGGLELVIQ